MRVVLLLFVVAIATVCCGSSAADCPFPASTCPSGCNPIEAYEDDRRTCEVRTVILGCTTRQQFTTDAACYFEPATGRTVRSSGSNLPEMIGWRRCEPGDVAPLMCGATDAGTDG